MMEDEFSVAEAAVALGTSPQTVRTLLRKGQLRGERRAWGSRYVWVVPSGSIDEFLSHHGRIDGRRRLTRVIPSAAHTYANQSPTDFPISEPGWTAEPAGPAPRAAEPNLVSTEPDISS